MHEERIRAGGAHHFGVDLPVLERAATFLVLRLEAHAGPHVGGDQIGAADGLHRIGERLVELIGVNAGALGLHLIAGRGRHVHVEAEHGGRLQPRIADVVRVADPRDG